MVILKGITWDHPRGLDPLVATSWQFHKEHPDIEIQWNVRTLAQFGNQPIEQLVHQYDLLMIDHPYVGTASKKRILEPLNEWITPERMENLRLNSVGPSFESYEWEDSMWALPVDAAAQVAVCRPDLMKVHQLEAPANWDELFRMADQLPSGAYIGCPLGPIDAYCTLLSICAQLGGNDWFTDGQDIDEKVVVEGLFFLKRLAKACLPSSLHMNPIQMLNRMSSSDEIVYIPLCFGYTNYARPAAGKKLLRFLDIPSFSGEPEGALLGGVGISISALSRHKQAAADYIAYVAAEEIQSGLYVDSGGQPAHRAAWVNEKVNAKSDRFFQRTLRTLDQSYLRPRHPGYAAFQESAFEMIHKALVDDSDVQSVAGQFVQQVGVSLKA